jgi:hypothetical protein
MQAVKVIALHEEHEEVRKEHEEGRQMRVDG